VHHEYSILNLLKFPAVWKSTAYAPPMVGEPILF